MKKILAGVVLSLSLVGCGVGVDEPVDQSAQAQQELTCRPAYAKCALATPSQCCSGVCYVGQFGTICR